MKRKYKIVLETIASGLVGTVVGIFWSETISQIQPLTHRDEMVANIAEPIIRGQIQTEQDEKYALYGAAIGSGLVVAYRFGKNNLSR